MNEPLPQFIHPVVDRLLSIEGIVAIALGGSRVRGNHTPKSDVDLGLYYQPENPPDLLALNHLASELDDSHRTNLITPIGEWEKWINGGGWLKVEGIPVDFLYRDIAQVNQVIDDCQSGHITIDYQPGHPHGFVSSIYMGEVNLGLPLHDPNGVFAALKAKTTPYPAKLRQATINKFAWEISFSLVVTQKAVARGDVVCAAGCCFRSVACINQVLFALNEVYLLNEKGAMALANGFTLCPADYQQRIEPVFALLAVWLQWHTVPPWRLSYATLKDDYPRCGDQLPGGHGQRVDDPGTGRELQSHPDVCVPELPDQLGRAGRAAILRADPDAPGVQPAVPSRTGRW